MTERTPASPAATTPSPTLPYPQADCTAAYRRAVDRLVTLQRPGGYWEGEMVWNTSILSQYVIVRHVVGRPLPPGDRDAAIRHYAATRAPEGGWPLHQEASSSPYCTVLAYVALRLLGMSPDDPLAQGSVSWLRSQPGGARAVPTSGKFWLATLGLYPYVALHPLPPETYLLPSFLPMHPDRLYCQTRVVSQAMSYLYGRRYRADLGALGRQLALELYGPAGCETVQPRDRDLLGGDVTEPPSLPLRLVRLVSRAYERRPSAVMRAAALRRCLARVEYEQLTTNHQALSPVSGLLGCLALYAENPEHPLLPKALDGVETWRHDDAERGLRIAGARSQTWDTSFTLEALAHGPQEHRTAEAVAAGASFLLSAQVTTEQTASGHGRREPVLGGWCFTDSRHRLPVSDCTAEAVHALLHGQDTGRIGPSGHLPTNRLNEAVSFLLSRQNRDGGFGSYERRRAPRILEAANPTEIFSNCMVEGSYIECTASALLALTRARNRVAPAYRPPLEQSVRQARAFLLRRQLEDGAWPAAWGVHYIYGTLFAVRGLRAAGLLPLHPALQRAARWLHSVQRSDGSWGEHYRSCTEGHFVPHPEGQPVMTAWALLALLDTVGPADASVQQGAAWLMSMQRPDGSWPELAVNGVFFGSAMLDYRLYHQYFPAWALGRLCSMTASAATPGQP